MNCIEVENLSKTFEIAHGRDNLHGSLKEQLAQGTLHFFKKLLRQPVESTWTTETFCALNNLSFSIKEGDLVALMGRNGAGKSTLLKLLARVIEPSSGRIKIRGRIASLLEVGTGFHPDLTGRENIFLNGAIMGMSKQEIKRKFDEIVDFAEVERFLDTPVKRYSSGMFMRLGFAIASQLDSEIMVLDEILAVGDQKFQQKCLKKMQQMGASGQTILFVSHTVQSVLSFCKKGIFLERGELKAFDSIDKVVHLYLNANPSHGFFWGGEIGNESIVFKKIALKEPASGLSYFDNFEKTVLTIEFDLIIPCPELVLGFTLLNARHTVLARSRVCDVPSIKALLLQPGTHKLSFPIDLQLLHPGDYQLEVVCSNKGEKILEGNETALKFTVCTKELLTKEESGHEREGISLGNAWKMDFSPN